MRLAQKLKTKTLLTLMRGVAGAERLIKGHSVDLFNLVNSILRILSLQISSSGFEH